MSVSIGGINIPESLIMCEWRLGVVERLLEQVMPFLPPGTVTQAKIDQIRSDVFNELQKKYPDAGLTLNSGPK
jgi:hypothetical protein